MRVAELVYNHYLLQHLSLPNHLQYSRLPMSNWGAEYDAETARERDPSRAPVATSSRARRLANNDEDVFMDSLDLTPDTPLELLVRYWMNERHAPDILASQEALLSSLLDHIRRQVCTILPC